MRWLPSLLAAVAAGAVAAIVVYDLSRLARNARLMLNLLHELERRQVSLLVANLPGAKFDGATGRYLFGQLCLAAQLHLVHPRPLSIDDSLAWYVA